MPDFVNGATANTTAAANKQAFPGGTATVWVRGTISEPTQIVLKASPSGLDDFVGLASQLSFRSPGQQDFTLSACDIGVDIINAKPDTNVTVSFESI